MDNLPQLHTGSLVLVLASPALGIQVMTDFTARLALGGPVRVLDGGNRFAAYPLARTVRRYSSQLEEVMRRVQIARAFTCYQMLALLAQSSEVPIPTLVLDLIATFLDESVALIERRYLLRQATDHLLRLSQQAPVAVSSSPLTADQPGDLLQTLVETADHIVRFEEPPPPHTQLRLL
jgi:hypothetical protein